MAKEENIATYLTIMSIDAHDNSKAKGFWEGNQNIAEKLCLIHSEVSEALEVIRKEDFILGQSPDFAAELADIIIRVGDLARACNVDIGMEVVNKMRKNAARPRKHGKRF